MPFRFAMIGSSILQGFGLIGTGLCGMWAAVATTIPEIDTQQLGSGSGQYILAVWVAAMIVAVGTLCGVVRHLLKLLLVAQREHREYMEKAHAERDRREDLYSQGTGEMVKAFEELSRSVDAAARITEQCHDKHVMIDSGQCMTAKRNKEK